MESLSRPPHRRKHSTTTNIFSSSFSFKSPYDGVLLSNGGERKSLEAHEYSEIFSGSSSIPVLDIPDLDEPAGPGDPRDSKLDYSNIFGGFTSGDVFVPYEKLLNRSAKKSKPRMPAESRPHLQESGARNSSRKTKKPSDEASDQSVDEVQKQINISFNKTNQRNGDASDGKTHVAELHAVPGFTHFFDGTPRLDKTKNDKLPSLKREVSRTWSFSAEVGRPKDEGRSSSETSQVGDKSHNVNEVNLKSQFSKVPPPSTCPSNPSGNKDPGFSRASFVSKEDASEKIFGDCLPPFSSEEFDENSVDAVSAAALKKAIEQAQESIRIAKMIMERKKEGYQDGSKPRPISSLNVSDREAQIDREAYVSKDNNAKGKHEELGHMFNVLAGIDGKFTQTLSHSDTISNAANSEVEKIWENVGADKKHGEAFAGKSERLHNGEHVKLEMLEENVEATDTQREAKEFPGSVANGVSGTVDLEPGKVGNINSLMPSWFKHPSNVGDMVNFKWRHVTSHHRERSGVIAEQVEKAVDTSQTMQRTGKSVDEDELCQATFDHAKGSGNLVERVLETSQMTEGVEKSVDEDELCEATFSHAKGPESTVERVLNTYQRTTDCCKFVDEAVVSIRQEGEVNKQRENENGNESLEQEDMENRYKNASKGKENGEHGEIHDEEIRITRQKEAHLWFGSKEQLKEALLEEITKREPDIPSETREVEKKVGECHEPEIDNRKQDFTDDGDEPKLAEGLVQNKFEEEHIRTCEHGAAGAVEIQEEGSFWDAEVTDNALEDSGRHGDNYNKCEIQEAAYEDNIDEAVELSSSDASTIFDEAQTNDEAQSKDTGPIISETQEACNVDLNNKAEEHQETVNFFNENDTMHEVSETVSAAEDKKAEPFFHLQDNETLGPNSLRRSASEEIFVENKLDDAFEGLSSDGKMDTVGAMDADPEENLPEDENVSHTTSDVHDSKHEYAAKIDAQNFPEHLASDIRTTEFDFADVRQVVEQTSESDEGSVSASNSEKIDRLSAHESEEWAENVMDMISDVEELKDELGDERKYVEDLSRDFFSELHSEPKEMDKPKKTGRDEEKGLNTENNKDNLAGTSPAEERDTKESEQHFDSNHQQQRIEAIKRGREREKDRIAVERAIREARERAFAEARERAERAAVEKASAEARQRVMTEAKEKVEKASTEAKLRVERAAVERATAEARERALEKAMSQKTSTERASSSSRNDGLKHSFSSSDLENGMNTESAQRRKARLERHQRIMERAAKALAEKNMRDLLARKEQAERNRLAESLDADIKRWATGKEGNLRALLSTLQYILGTDNGWQPISLTEIITTAAVKKAYRKATLYVHPDKLQQRGASVQQKYICEKVFDLLKAAWNRFNSDER